MSVRDLIPWSRGNNQAPSIYRDENMDPFLSLHRNVNRLFDEVFRDFDTPSVFGRMTGRNGTWPSVEFSETDKEIRVTAEVPGLDEKDIEVLLDDGVLTLRGEKKSETEDKDRQFSERYYGRFERRSLLAAKSMRTKSPRPSRTASRGEAAEDREGAGEYQADRDQQQVNAAGAPGRFRSRNERSRSLTMILRQRLVLRVGSKAETMAALHEWGKDKQSVPACGTEAITSRPKQHRCGILVLGAPAMPMNTSLTARARLRGHLVSRARRA